MSVQECIQGALATAREKVGDVKVIALGITNQRETTLVWDKATGHALHKAIVWMDTRTESICKQMEQELGSKACFAQNTVSHGAWLFRQMRYS